MSGDNRNKPRLDIINDKIKELELDKETNKDELVKLYIDCDHEIREVGYGYQCQKCLLYTGTNSNRKELP